MDVLSLIAPIFVTLTVLTIVGLIIYLKYDSIKKKRVEKQSNKKNSNTDNKSESKDNKNFIKEMDTFINIENISHGIIKTMSDKRLCVIFSISTPDIELLTEEEQALFEDMLMGFNLALSFPIQYQTASARVDTSPLVERIDTLLKNDTSANLFLTNYRENYKQYLKGMENKNDILNQSQNFTRSYLVISTRPNLETKRALTELKNRIDTTVGMLTQARIKVKMLDSSKAVEVFHQYFNHGSSIKVENFIESGVLDLYSNGLGFSIEVESEKND